MYAHSNELEEVGIISLTGVKVEHNPNLETLFGVSLRALLCAFVLKSRALPETIHLYTLYGLKLTRLLGAKCKRTLVLDHETRPDTDASMT